MNKHYAVVTFGTPAVNIPKVFTSLELARAAALRAKGSGSCNNAHVLECDSRALARTADMSEVRSGERTVFLA